MFDMIARKKFFHNTFRLLTKAKKRRVCYAKKDNNVDLAKISTRNQTKSPVLSRQRDGASLKFKSLVLA